MTMMTTDKQSRQADTQTLEMLNERMREEEEEEEEDKTVCDARLNASALLRLVPSCTATPTRRPSNKR